MLYKTLFLNLDKRQRWAAFPAYFSSFLVMYRVLFLYLTKTSFDVLNCTPTQPPTFTDPINLKGSIMYMNGLVQDQYICWKTGSWQVFLFPFGVATLGIYSVALPLLVLYTFRKNREAIKTDQILRAKGVGDDRLTNPRFFDFRQTWQKLYLNYLPGKWYWEFVIVFRKIGIAGVSLAFRTVPSYQLAVALLILFMAYVLHVLHWPYMSHTTLPAVVEEHERKALYDPLHSKIESDMREARRKNVRATQRNNVLDVQRSKNIFTAQAMLIFFDTNTVESTLLAVCILMALAGIMLCSPRFSGENMAVPTIKTEYTSISWGVIFIVIFAFLYYAYVFFVELCLAFCKDFVPTVLAVTCCCLNKKSKMSAEQLKAAAAAAKTKESDTVINPLMLKGDVSAQDMVIDASFGALSILDAASLSKIDAPTAAMWRNVQTSYGRLMDMTHGFRSQIRDAKVGAQKYSNTEEAIDGTQPGRAPRRASVLGVGKKAAFGPMLQGGFVDSYSALGGGGGSSASNAASAVAAKQRRESRFGGAAKNALRLKRGSTAASAASARALPISSQQPSTPGMKKAQVVSLDDNDLGEDMDL
jgi:hypothetical protein